MARRIKHKGRTQKRITAARVGKLLGAETTARKVSIKKAPLGLAALQDFVHGKLRSTGGRPALAGTEKVRRKVCLFKRDLERLKRLAERLSNEHRKVTPLQLVACIVHKELEKLLAQQDE